MADDAVSRKETLRRRLIDARSRRTAADLQRAGERIADHGVAAWSGLDRVAAYRSFGTEPSTERLLERLRQSGVTVLVPVIVGGDLDWVAFTADTQWRDGSLGVPEPTGPRLGSAAATAVGAVVVPALAVDRSGGRLGRGRGYYDRVLAPVTSPVIAVVYDEELLDSLPTEPHDRRVDAVLTPSHGLRPLSATR